MIRFRRTMVQNLAWLVLVALIIGMTSWITTLVFLGLAFFSRNEDYLRGFGASLAVSFVSWSAFLRFLMKDL